MNIFIEINVNVIIIGIIALLILSLIHFYIVNIKIKKIIKFFLIIIGCLVIFSIYCIIALLVFAFIFDISTVLIKPYKLRLYLQLVFFVLIIFIFNNFFIGKTAKLLKTFTDAKSLNEIIEISIALSMFLTKPLIYFGSFILSFLVSISRFCNNDLILKNLLPIDDVINYSLITIIAFDAFLITLRNLWIKLKADCIKIFKTH